MGNWKPWQEMVKIQHTNAVNGYQIFLPGVDGHRKIDFLCERFFGSGHFSIHDIQKKRSIKWPESTVTLPHF